MTIKIDKNFLNKATVPNGKDYVNYTDNGLIARIYKSGTVTFHYQYRVNGKRRILTLGRYPDIKPTQARDNMALARADNSEIEVRLQGVYYTVYHIEQPYQPLL